MKSLKDMVSIRQAARQEKVRFSRIRELIDAGKVQGFKDGGSESRPRIRVDPGEIREALLNASRYQPPATNRTLRRRSVVLAATAPTSHPDVTC